MTLEELLAKIDPTCIWENAMDRAATPNSFYLYELHLMSFNSWDAHVWIFDTTQQFRDFIPALLFRDLLYLDDAAKFKGMDFSQRYEELLYLQNTIWDLNRCKEFIANYKSKDLELLEFDSISELINISNEHYEICKQTLYIDPKVEFGISQAKYKILHKFALRSDIKPAFNQDTFLEFISGEVN